MLELLLRKKTACSDGAKTHNKILRQSRLILLQWSHELMSSAVAEDGSHGRLALILESPVVERVHPMNTARNDGNSNSFSDGHSILAVKILRENR